jgi:hypothetical protein
LCHFSGFELLSANEKPRSRILQPLKALQGSHISGSFKETLGFSVDGSQIPTDTTVVGFPLKYYRWELVEVEFRSTLS